MDLLDWEVFQLLEAMVNWVQVEVVVQSVVLGVTEVMVRLSLHIRQQ